MLSLFCNHLLPLQINTITSYINQMNSILLLLFLVWLATPAILGQNIFTLSRLLEYRLHFSSGLQNIVEFATIAPTIDGCVAGQCFYGWINNYTVGNQTYPGFNKSQTDNPVFYVRLQGTSSFTLTYNSTLKPQVKNLIAITSRLLMPFYQIYSNVGTRNSQALYEFAPYDLQSQAQAPNNAIGEVNFSQLPQSFQTSTNLLGWRLSDPKSDILLHNKPMNCLLGRQIVTKGGTINIGMTNKSVFQDMDMFSKIIAQLSTNNDNVMNVILNDSSLFPAGLLAGLFQ